VNVIRLRPMTVADLDRVMAIEAQAYAFPWSRGNLIDSLAAGYLAQVLEAEGGELLGYFVAMPGVDELHLLNVTVAPQHQGGGHGRRLLEAVEALARARGDGLLWLEVRASNQRAQQMYRARGFVQSGLRRGYYPAPGSRREDAVVMRLLTTPAAGAGPHEAAAGALHGAG
jgi:[ribosomal protein S18]-alanine N-acetyltransferase